MKKLYILLLFLCINTLYSQNFTIKGQISDGENNPIEFATINLHTENDISIKTELSDEFGKFEIEEKQGNYILEISFLGKSVFKENILLDKDKDLGIIQVENTKIIEEITITKEKKLIEKKVDRLVFNVENSVVSTGGDVFDVLKIVPRVRVDNDQISMIGKGGMAMMIDGRMTNMSGDALTSFLKTLRSEDIKSIEIIPNPPAKYSAEGNIGLINIVTKKRRLDVWNASMRSVFQQASYPVGLGGLGFNLKKNKITLTSYFSYTDGSNSNLKKTNIYYPNITWYERGKGKRFTKRNYANLGLDYKISDKTSTGFFYNYLDNKPKMRENIITAISDPPTSSVDSLIITAAKNNRQNISNNLNYHFIYDIDTLGKKLSFDFDFFNYESNSNRVFATDNYYNDLTPIPNSHDSANNIGKQKILNYSFNLDMEHPFSSGIYLNYGGRLSRTETDSNYEYYDLKSGMPIFDTSQSNMFEYNENSQALYFSAEKKFTQEWSAKAGLRLENTQLKGHSVTLNQENKSSYTKLFPTAYLSFTPNDNHSFSLNYSRRITRPDFNDLNPFKWINSPYSYSEGNPYLQPSFSNIVELEYILKENYVTTLYFSQNDDGFENTTILDPQTNVQRITLLNFLTNRVFVFNQSVNVKPLEWLNINFQGDINYNDTKSEIPTTLNYLNGWGGSFYLGNYFTLNKEQTIVFNFAYSYIARGIDNLDRNSSYDKFEASLRASFLEKKLSVNLYAYDIFRSYRPVYTTYYNGIKNSFSNYFDDRRVGVSVTYNFGKQFGINNRESKNSEEVNRAN